MTDTEIAALETALADWLIARGATVEATIFALAFCAARCVHGVGEMQGERSASRAQATFLVTFAKARDAFAEEAGKGQKEWVH